jgi:copper homeostasis protein
MINLEICANSVDSAIAAQQGGAIRVELCDNLLEGGTTPSIGQIKQARSSINIQLYPIIRPRGGDFLFNENEFEIMKSDIRACVAAGCDGVVIGILKADGQVDKERCQELVELAGPLGVTFHRAFDVCADPFQALEDIIAIGCERILTSGCKPTAFEGAEMIRQLIEKSAGRISIMPGSGVREENIALLVGKTGAKEFHTTAKSTFPSGMQYFNPEISFSADDHVLERTSPEIVKKILSKANSVYI